MASAGDSTRPAGAALEAPPRPNLHRVCTECGRQLKSRRHDAKTCSATCRTKRSRRLRRLKNGTIPPEDPAGQGVKALAPMVATKGGTRVRDILAKTFQEELRPIIREQITEETLRAIQGLVALTPVMVEAIGRDLEHPDPQIRQRAYSVMARYTLGHTAIVTPPEEASRKTMTVIFDGMVRPGQDPEPREELPAPEARPRTCDVCQETKPADQFVEDSDRCQACHGQLLAKLRDVLGEEHDGVA